MIGEPLLARRERRRLRGEQGAHGFSGRYPDQHIGLVPRGDHGLRSRAGGALGSEYLGEHAALGDGGAGSARYFFEPWLAGQRFAHQRGLRIASGIVGVKPLLVGEDDQTVGFDEIGHQRGERVVIAEPDFVGNDGVVFVDHGDDPESEQRQQGGAGI